MVRLRFSYDVVTEESAADGDVAERGWYVPGLGKFPVEDDSAAEFTVIRARDAVRQISCTVGSIDSFTLNGDRLTFYPADSEQDYASGDRTSYYAHIEADPRLITVILAALGCGTWGR